jgi:hypothetical protein
VGLSVAAWLSPQTRGVSIKVRHCCRATFLYDTPRAPLKLTQLTLPGLSATTGLASELSDGVSLVPFFFPPAPPPLPFSPPPLDDFLLRLLTRERLLARLPARLAERLTLR